MSFLKKNKIIFEITKPRVLQNRGAAIFIVLLFTLSISLIIILGFTTPLIREFQNARNNLYTTQSYYAAEAGNEDAYYRIKNNMLYDSFEQLAVGGATSSVSITVSGGITTISSSSSVLSRVRKVETKVSKSVYSINLQQNAVSVGAGGLDLNGATVKGSGGEYGNVYSNGPIKNGTITGNAISASYSLPDLGAQSTTCNSDVLVGKTSAEQDYAQSFKPSATGQLSNVSLYIKENGSPSATVRIVEDNGSNQPKTVATSSTSISNVGTAYSWINISFANAPVLIAGQRYWIVLDANGSFSSKYFTWCKDAGDTYASGTPAYNNDWSDGSWTAATGDMTFKTYFGLGLGKISNVTVGIDAKANTILDSTVGRDAYYQTKTNTTVSGISYATSTDPVPLEPPIPDSEINTWKADSLATPTTIIDGGYSTTTTPTNLGPAKIINGNLTLNNSQTLIVGGTIYVTGNIVLGNNSITQCASAYGSNGCIVITDGTITFGNNAIGKGSGTPGSFVLFVSTLTTGTAMTVANNTDASDAILYAPHAKISVSNGADVAAILGYEVDLSNNVDVIYKSTLNTLNFTPKATGGGDIWTINSWKEVE